MSAPLPTPVAQYFEAFNARDAGALGDSFSEHAALLDEGREVQGRVAIRAWEEDQLGKEARRIDVLTFSQSEGRVAVMGRLHGDFLASPHEVRFVFTLQGDRIERLEIGRVS